MPLPYNTPLVVKVFLPVPPYETAIVVTTAGLPSVPI